MKKLLLASFLFLSILSLSFAQAPGVQWQKALNPKSYNTSGQLIYGMSKVNSGGYVFVGSDTGYQFNKSAAINKEDGEWPMIIRTDTAGNITWAKRSANAQYQSAYTAITATSSGEFVAAGFAAKYTTSLIFDLSVTKYANNGTVVWDKTFGGSKMEYAQSVIKTTDGGFAIAGYTNSNDGNVSGNHGTNKYDFWVLKLDNAGNLVWQKCYGGSGNEKAYDIKQTLDGGYIVVGKDSSSNGDLTQGRGADDAWVIKLDTVGNLQWQKALGGSNMEVFKSIVQTADGGYLAVGNTLSTEKDVSGNHGMCDIWVVRLDQTGNIIWQKCLGGSKSDYASAITATDDKAYLITGSTESSDGDVIDHNGGADAWLIKIDDAGNIIWNKPIGSAKNEYGVAVAAITENEFVVAGYGDAVPPVQFNDPSDGIFFKLGNTSSVKGTVFMDYNLNGIKEPAEPFYNNVLVKTEKPGYVRSAIPVNGLFKIDVDTGKYQTTVHINSPYYNVVPATFTSEFATYFDEDLVDFAIQPIPGKHDLSINLFALTPARPGFAAQYRILYKNQGTETVVNGTVQFIKSNKLTVVSTLPAFSSVSGDTLRWNYSNFKPQDTAGIVLNFTVKSPPTVVNGEVLTSIASITPVISDITPADDTSKLSQTVVGSYDPNDKTEVHGGVLTNQQVAGSDWLLYTIRFQNTGTDTAFTVVVRDTLTNKVNWNSLEMIKASHAYHLNIKEGNLLTWTFDNIRLVDSNRNESASHGYIVFRIKANNNLAPGDTVKNTASIYFDYNLPVTTNVQKTVVENVIFPVKLIAFAAKRDGINNLLQWTTSGEMNVDVFEVQVSADGRTFSPVGNVHSQGNNSKYNFIHNTPGKAVNYYRLKIIDKDGAYYYSVIRTVNNKKPVELTMYPNPAKDVLTLRFNSDKTSAPVIDIIDLNGKILSSRTMIVNAGIAVRKVAITNLSSGSYFLRVKLDGEEQMVIPFNKL